MLLNQSLEKTQELQTPKGNVENEWEYKNAAKKTATHPKRRHDQSKSEMDVTHSVIQKGYRERQKRRENKGR